MAYAGALGGLLLLAARRRPLGTAPRGLRVGAVAVLATVAPTLIVGCEPTGKRFGSFRDAALFFVTDAVGSTILAVRTDGVERHELFRSRATRTSSSHPSGQQSTTPIPFDEISTTPGSSMKIWSDRIAVQCSPVVHSPTRRNA